MGLWLLVFMWVAAVGLVVGSYLNVVIHRMPRGVSTVLSRSRCPVCDEAIRPWDNIPLLSFLLLRGRCRSCRSPIVWRYPAVEALTALCFTASLLRFGWTWETPLAWLFSSLLIALAGIDLEHFILPDRITLSGLTAGLLLTPLVGWQRWWEALLGAAVGGGILLLVYAAWLLVRREEGLGLGDLKMLAMIGAFLGWQQVLVTLFVASSTGSIVGLGLMAAGRAGRRTALPFGVFLAVGGLVALFFGSLLVEIYQGAVGVLGSQDGF
jgi:leader peptidase (prepilin peptidase)/N-methyltransferase